MGKEGNVPPHSKSTVCPSPRGSRSLLPSSLNSNDLPHWSISSRSRLWFYLEFVAQASGAQPRPLLNPRRRREELLRIHRHATLCANLRAQTRVRSH